VKQRDFRIKRGNLSGETGIRTPGTLAGSPVFETGNVILQVPVATITYVNVRNPLQRPLQRRMVIIWQRMTTLVISLVTWVALSGHGKNFRRKLA